MEARRVRAHPQMGAITAKYLRFLPARMDRPVNPLRILGGQAIPPVALVGEKTRHRKVNRLRASAMVTPMGTTVGRPSF
jgi:hypothetical protein